MFSKYLKPILDWVKDFLIAVGYFIVAVGILLLLVAVVEFIFPLLLLVGLSSLICSL